jgi:hypothetical protein
MERPPRRRRGRRSWPRRPRQRRVEDLTRDVEDAAGHDVAGEGEAGNLGFGVQGELRVLGCRSSSAMEVRVLGCERSSYPKMGRSLEGSQGSSKLTVGYVRGGRGSKASWGCASCERQRRANWPVVELRGSTIIVRRKKMGKEDDWDVGPLPVRVYGKRRLVPNTFSVKHDHSYVCPPMAAKARSVGCNSTLRVLL